MYINPSCYLLLIVELEFFRLLYCGPTRLGYAYPSRIHMCAVDLSIHCEQIQSIQLTLPRFATYLLRGSARSLEDLYGISIALIIHSLDPSLFAQLILREWVATCVTLHIDILYKRSRFRNIICPQSSNSVF